MLHRDIKPGNIFVSSGQTMKIGAPPTAMLAHNLCMEWLNTRSLHICTSLLVVTCFFYMYLISVLCVFCKRAYWCTVVVFVLSCIGLRFCPAV